METKLKPFDLEAAKNGAKVVTRDGHAVRIICYDRKNEEYPIVALVGEDEGAVFSYSSGGICSLSLPERVRRGNLSLSRRSDSG